MDTTWWPPSFLAPKGHKLIFYKFIICVCVSVLQPNGHLFSPSQGTPLGGHQLYSTQVTQPFFSIAFVFFSSQPSGHPVLLGTKIRQLDFPPCPKDYFFPPKTI